MAYAKGETGNSRGQIRPKPVRDALNALLSRDADDPLNDTPKTMAQKVALSLMKDALDPDIKIRADARAELIDRTDGKAVQAIEHSGFIGSHEDALEDLDKSLDQNDAAREGTTPPAAR